VVGGPVSRRRRRARLARHRGVVFHGGSVGAFYGPEPSGYPCLAGGDGLAVVSPVRVIGQGVAELFDLSDVGLTVAGICGEGVPPQARSPPAGRTAPARPATAPSLRRDRCGFANPQVSGPNNDSSCWRPRLRGNPGPDCGIG
jgi:hypothetical protein